MTDEPTPRTADGSADVLPQMVAHWRRNRGLTVRAAATAALSLQTSGPRIEISAEIPVEAGAGAPAVTIYPEIILQTAILAYGDKVKEGHLIEGVSVAWDEILKECDRDPNFIFRLTPRQFEELIAGAYAREGWDVILTPASGDRGRDVIATRRDVGAIRFLDQAKAFAPHHRVTADDVRAMYGVVSLDQNVSKGIVTTTAEFAPGVFEEFKEVIPYRLDLKDGKQLLKWLRTLRPA